MAKEKKKDLKNEVEYHFLHVWMNTSQKKSQGAIYPKGYEAKTPSA